MSDKTTQHKVGSFVKTKRGEVHKVLGQIGTTLHATKYHGKGLYGGNVILHSSNVYPVSAPTDMKESIDQYCLAITDNISFTTHLRDVNERLEQSPVLPAAVTSDNKSSCVNNVVDEEEEKTQYWNNLFQIGHAHQRLGDYHYRKAKGSQSEERVSKHQKAADAHLDASQRAFKAADKFARSAGLKTD